MHRGYTKRWRKRWDKNLHQDLLLWVMMDYFIDFACYEDKEFPFIWKGALVEIVKVKRGQCFFTFQGLANLLNGPLNPVSRKMIRRRVEILHKIEFLEHQSGRQYQIVTILNYDRYNPLPADEEHQSGHEGDMKGTLKGHNRDITNKDNKVKNNIGGTSVPPCPFSEIVSIYHKECPSLPAVQNNSDRLKKRLKARWREDEQRQNIDWWTWYFKNVNLSNFLTGKVKDWNADFYWLIGPENMTKVLNGRYGNKGSKTDKAIEDFVNE